MIVFFNNIAFHFTTESTPAPRREIKMVANAKGVWRVVEPLLLRKTRDFDELFFVSKQPQVQFDAFRKYFTEVPAAGGIIRKGDKFLLMKRRGFWDLPKGKIDPGETEEDAAVREVKEECGVVVRILRYITTSWHIYTANGQLMLKPTTWFEMICLDDSTMQPETREQITELRWETHNKARLMLRNSFASLQKVFRDFEQA